VGFEDARAVPGMVASIQTFGSFANFHPHLHALARDRILDRFRNVLLDSHSVRIVPGCDRHHCLVGPGPSGQSFCNLPVGPDNLCYSGQLVMDLAGWLLDQD
jgi:hypothetical protein